MAVLLTRVQIMERAQVHKTTIPANALLALKGRIVPKVSSIQLVNLNVYVF